jgi:hypothetical protein
MEISYGRVFASSTCVTVGSAAISSRTRCPRIFSVRSSVGPVSAMSMTPRCGVANVMTGFSVSSGNVSSASTRFLTSSRARLSSASSKSSTRTMQEPSFAVDWMRSTPSMPSSSSSIRMQTPCSTSSGAAPRYSTLTVISFTSMSGNGF